MKHRTKAPEPKDDSYDPCRNCPCADDCEDTCIDIDDDNLTYEQMNEKWGEGNW